MNHRKYSISVIDDHPIIHDGIRELISSEPDLEITGKATSSTMALKQLESHLPDLAIVDLSLGDLDGIHLIQRIKTTHPEIRILVYTMSEEKLFAERVAAAGAEGYVMKTSPPATLKEAIHTVLVGKCYFSPGTMQCIQNHPDAQGEGPEALLDTLSTRERAVFKLIGEGVSASAITTRLKICHNTLDTHRINIKNKLGLANGKALDRLAYEVSLQGAMPAEK
jgi:DNA-binding NarL/FixJ family response regulator